MVNFYCEFRNSGKTTVNAKCESYRPTTLTLQVNACSVLGVLGVVGFLMIVSSQIFISE